MRGGESREPLGAVRDADGGVVWIAALDSGVSIEVVAGGSTRAELRVRLLTIRVLFRVPARGVCAGE